MSEDLNDFECHSREEQYLKNCCLGLSCDNLVPQSRSEILLKALATNIGEIAAGGNVTVDSEISDTSENAIQNKAVKNYIDEVFGEISSELTNLNSGEGV